ncbi:MAG: transport permease protein [Candidatus Binatia bacterium]|nr:MAG: transport permease protein [Candidatus Binatia bacterium]
MRKLWLSLRRIGAVSRKELRQLVRDRLTLAMIVGIPAIQLVLFGYAIELDVRNVGTVVVDRSRSALSRKLLGELVATQTFRVLGEVASEQEGLELLERSRAGALLVLPADLDAKLLRGRGAEIGVVADATNPTVAAAVTSSAQGFEWSWQARYHRVPGSAATRADREDRPVFGPEPELVRARSFRVAVLPFYNPERRTEVFIVPGLVGVILTMTMMLMTALAVVRERERGTFEFLIATPVGRTEVMVGKILPYIVVGYVQIALVLGIGGFGFGVPLRGSLWDFALGSLPFIATMLVLGLLVSSLARTQFQAMQMSFFFFLPSILLSGFMFPFEAMPEPAQWIGEVLPLTHFLRVVRGVLLKGAPLRVLWPEILAMLAFGLLALLVAVRSFRKELE